MIQLIRRCFLSAVMLILFSCMLFSADENTLIIRNARIFDGTGGLPLENAVIHIEDGRFTHIGQDGEIQQPLDARVIDAGGRWVVPGLIDAHYHMNYPNNREKPFVLNDAICAFRASHHLRRHLMGGITTIMDAGAYHDVSFMAKKAFQDGFLLGSRPVVVGERINATGGHGVSRFDMAYEADGPDEFRKAVRLQIKKGADVIKILPPYTRAELQAAMEEAHLLRKMVAVHSGYLGGEPAYIRWAAELGADVIEHAYALPDDVIQIMGEKQIYGVPTMTIMMKLHQQRGKVIPDDQPHEYEIIFQKMKAAGVPMAIGTDAIYEFMDQNPDLYFEEVERFVKNGYSPEAALIAATRIGAEAIDADDRLGTIEKGKIADLLVIDGNPIQNIRDLRNVMVIIQEGRIIKDLLKP